MMDSFPPHLQYVLRGFRENDLEQVIAINERCLPENYSSSFFLDLYKSYPAAFIVAEYDDGLAGYIMCRIESGFSEFSRFRFAKKGHVVSVAVMPEHRRRSVASALMLAGIRGMENYRCTETYLEVRENNYGAISMYEKLGYRTLRKVPGYYFNGEVACVMGAKLPLDLDHKQVLNSPSIFIHQQDA